MAVSLLINSLKEAVAVGKAARTMVSKKHQSGSSQAKKPASQPQRNTSKGNSEQQKEKAQKPTAVNATKRFFTKRYSAHGKCRAW